MFLKKSWNVVVSSGEVEVGFKNHYLSPKSDIGDFHILISVAVTEFFISFLNGPQ